MAWVCNLKAHLGVLLGYGGNKLPAHLLILVDVLAEYLGCKRADAGIPCYP